MDEIITLRQTVASGGQTTADTQHASMIDNRRISAQHKTAARYRYNRTNTVLFFKPKIKTKNNDNKGQLPILQLYRSTMAPSREGGNKTEKRHQRRPQHPRYIHGYRVANVLLLLCLCSCNASNNPQKPHSSSLASSASSSSITGATSSSTLSSAVDESAACTNNEREKKKKSPEKQKKNKTAEKSDIPEINRPKSRPPINRSSIKTSSQSIFIRRIQREWKDAVQMGIAYDWVKGQPIQSSKKSNKKSTNGTTKSNETDLVENGNTTYVMSEKNQDNHICLGPIANNYFVWHFSIMGMEGSVYEKGIYHGRLILPPNYPAKPPRVQVWTPSGRFVPRADICLSASAFHPETWNPSAWSLRTILESLRLHFITPATEIGGMSAKPEQRQELARNSRSWLQHFQVSANSGKKKDRKSQPKILVSVDHAKLIQQGTFPSVTAYPGQSIAESENDSSNSVSNQDNNTHARSTSNNTSQNNVLDPTERPQDGCESIPDSSAPLQQLQTSRRKKKRKSSKKTAGTATVIRQEAPSSSLVIVTIKKLLSDRRIRLLLIAFYVYFGLVR